MQPATANDWTEPMCCSGDSPMPQYTPVPAALRRPTPVPLDQRLAWSIPEAARALGVSERLLSRLVSEGRIPCSRLGRRVLLDPQAVRAAVFAPSIADTQ
jgi:excisionase family DNA binding protein